MELKTNELLFSTNQEKGQQQNSLALGKRTVTELTDGEMLDVDGGSTLLCVSLVTILVTIPITAS